VFSAAVAASHARWQAAWLSFSSSVISVVMGFAFCTRLRSTWEVTAVGPSCQAPRFLSASIT
jgi:hypothetical protein